MTVTQDVPRVSRAAALNYERHSGFAGLFDLLAERGRVKIDENENNEELK
jgi:hypothetical protein